jgi:hypothetical protein
MNHEVATKIKNVPYKLDFYTRSADRITKKTMGIVKYDYDWTSTMTRE